MSVTLDQADALAHSLVHTSKALRYIRRHLPAPAPGVDHATYPALFTLNQGPARVSTIAEQIGSDISTVSRQVTQLIEAGLAGRSPDPADGRSHLVELTAAGREAIERTRATRAQWFHDRVRDWEPGDVETFVVALDRLHESITHAESTHDGQQKDA